MTAVEQTFDLLKLFVAVRDKGGYDAVSRNDLWDLVAEDSGLGSIIPSTVKVLYVECLNILERWLEKVVEDKESSSSCSSKGDGTGFEFNGLSSDIQYLKKNDDLHEDTKLLQESNFLDCDDTVVILKTDRDNDIYGCGETFCQLNKSDLDIPDTDDLYEDEDTSPELSSNVNDILMPSIRKHENVSADGVVESNVEFSHGGGKCDGDDPDNEGGVILDSTSIEEQNLSHERKCESLLGMVRWITEIAKNPSYPVIGSLPERSKWKSRGNEEIWKQVLLIREAMLLKRHSNSFAGRSILQVYFYENLFYKCKNHLREYYSILLIINIQSETIL